MNKITRIALLVSLVIVIGTAADTQPPKYYEANHGYSGGDIDQVDLSALDGFDQIRRLDQLAAFAAKVPGAIGFTAHPDFEVGKRYAHAIIGYTALSQKNQSWALYLYDKVEAEKPPGTPTSPRAEVAFEMRVQAKLVEAQKLIDEGGEKGVKLTGVHSKVLPLAYAILRLGGEFEHTGMISADICLGCRTIVPGSNPKKCGLGVARTEHWNCCGQGKNTQHCPYWKLFKAEGDRKEAEIQKSKEPVSNVDGPNKEGGISASAEHR